MSTPTPQVTLDDLLRAANGPAAPAWKEPLFQRGALFRAIDQRLYDTVLSRDIPDLTLTFDDWSKLPEVAPVPGSPGCFYLKDDVRSAFLLTWNRNAGRLREFSRRAADFLHDGEPLDRLALEIFADPANGLELCRTAYDAADTAGDLSTCEALLRLLRNRSELLQAQAPPINRYLHEQEQYLRSRILFAGEFARSSHYLDRPTLTTEVETFLEGTKQWLLQIYAAGGLGKTAFLNWLISRRLIVSRRDRPARYPVARIDFDRVNRAAAATSPVLLLVPIAAQLDRQLPYEEGSSIFGGFLRDYEQQYSGVLVPVATRGDDVEGTSRSAELSDSRTQEIERDFRQQLAKRQALIVLDTVEEMVLHHTDGWLKALKLLQTIQAGCTGLKVIVSGRLDIRIRSDFDELTKDKTIAAAMTTMALPALTKDEAFRYLTEQRHLKPAFRLDELTDVPGEGNPFKLAALADRMGAGGTVTIADLDELREGIEYLIRRIVERVPDPELQWLLRYVVVPNELTKAFVGDVLIPVVRHEAGSQELDQPHEHLPEGADVVKNSASWKPVDAPFDVNRLWTALGNYAAESSWITNTGGRPKLQPDLLVPMRFLLRLQPVHAKLHTDAAKYFEKKAAPLFGDDAAAFTAEALYHWFQAKGAAASADWRRLTRGPKSTPRFVIRVTASLLTGNYLDDHNEPLPHLGDAPIITIDTLADVHAELARARAFLLVDDVGEPGQLAKEITFSLKVIERLEVKTNRTLVGAERLAFCRAALEWPHGDLEKMRRVIEDTLKLRHLEPTDRVLLLYTHAVFFYPRDAKRPYADFEEAASIASANDVSLVFEDMIRSRQGRMCFFNGQLELATNAFAAAADALTRREGSPTLYLRYVLNLIETLYQSARWSAIPEWIEAARTSHAQPAEIETFVGEQRRRLFSATLRLKDLQTLSHPAPKTASEMRWSASLMALLQHAETLDAFGQAATLFERDGDLVSTQSCAIDALDYVVNVLGQLPRAAALASHLEPTGANWFRGNQALIELDRQVNPSKARSMWSRLWQEAVARNIDVRERAAALAFALAGGLVPRSEASTLADLISTITPPASRVTLLTAFELWKPGNDQAPGDTPELIAALPTLADDDPDFVLRALPLADALLFADRAHAARALLHKALERQPDTNEPLLMRRLFGGLRRAGVPPDPAPVEHYLAGGNDSSGASEFVFAVHVEQTEWWLECGFIDYATATLAAAVLPEGEPDQFKCRYFALRSRLATDDAETETYKLRATAMMSQLGQRDDFVSLDRVQRGKTMESIRTPDRATMAPHGDAATDQRDLFVLEADMVLVNSNDDALKLVAQRVEGGYRQVEVPVEHPALRELLHERRQSTAGLEDLFADRESGTSALRQLIDPQELFQGPPTDPRTGLLLSFRYEAMRMLPWQWILGDSHWGYVSISNRTDPGVDTIAWLQSMLGMLETPLIVDGIAGPKTRQVLAEYERKHPFLEHGKLTPVAKRELRRRISERVLTIGGLYEMERSMRTGYGAFGVNASQFWNKEQGFMWLLESDLSPDLLTSMKPTLIHIALPIAQKRNEIQLVTPPIITKQASAGVELTPSALGRMLNSVAPSGVRPMIVIDVPHQGSRGEAVKMLLLRNQFAAQLSAIASLPILATGLAGGRTPDLLAALVKHVALGNTIATFAAEAADISPDCPPAIFTGDPTLPL